MKEVAGFFLILICLAVSTAFIIKSFKEKKIYPLKETSLVLNAKEIIEVPIPESKNVKIRFYKTGNLSFNTVLLSWFNYAEDEVKGTGIERIFTKRDRGVYLDDKTFLGVFHFDQCLFIKSSEILPGEIVTVKLDSGQTLDLKLCPSPKATHTEISIIPRESDPQKAGLLHTI